MDCKLERKEKILISMCDNTGKLSIPKIFSMFMDLACEHGASIGIGSDKLAEKDLIWLTVKTKVHINRRPAIMDEVTAETWPEKPGTIRCNRYYRIFDDTDILAEGKSEWAMLNIKSGRLAKLAEAYPIELEHPTETVCSEPFTPVSKDFSEAETLGEYLVTSADIDMAQHMNNAAYIRSVFSLFSCKQLEEINITDIEIAFRSPCFEGDKLAVKYRKTETGYDIGVFREDLTLASTIKIIF